MGSRRPIRGREKGPGGAHNAWVTDVAMGLLNKALTAVAT